MDIVFRTILKLFSVHNHSNLKKIPGSVKEPGTCHDVFFTTIYLMVSFSLAFAVKSKVMLNSS